MRTKVQRLPKNVVFDYRSVTGAEIYHTKKRIYEVFERDQFGRKKKVIYSEPYEAI